MKYNANIEIQNFIERLVEVLKYENTYGELNDKKLDVPFFSICAMAGFNG